MCVYSGGSAVLLVKKKKIQFGFDNEAEKTEQKFELRSSSTLHLAISQNVVNMRKKSKGSE